MNFGNTAKTANSLMIKQKKKWTSKIIINANVENCCYFWLMTSQKKYMAFQVMMNFLKNLWTIFVVIAGSKPFVLPCAKHVALHNINMFIALNVDPLHALGFGVQSVIRFKLNAILTTIWHVTFAEFQLFFMIIRHIVMMIVILIFAANAGKNCLCSIL